MSTMQDPEQIQVKFDFSTGEVEFVFEDNTSYSYTSELGAELAVLFEELIEEAYQDYVDTKQRRERKRHIN